MEHAIFEISGLSKAQAKTAISILEELGIEHGISGCSYCYSPNTNHPIVAQNTLQFSFFGKDLTAFKAAVRAEAQQRGLTLSRDEPVVTLIQGLKSCLQTHGTALADRPALKACVMDVWRTQSQCSSPEEYQELRERLRRLGFKSFRQLKAWLNQTE